VKNRPKLIKSNWILTVHFSICVFCLFAESRENNLLFSRYESAIKSATDEQLKVVLDINKKCMLSKSMDNIIENDLFSPPIIPVNITNEQKKIIELSGTNVLRQTWRLRLQFLKKIRDLNTVKQQIPAACIQQVHRYLSYLRFSEEQLIQFLMKNNLINKKTVDDFSLSVDLAQSSDFHFEPGDLILNYGRTVSSAFASQIVFPGRAFSHIAMVASQNGNLVVIDLYPPKAIVIPLLQWLRTDLVRIAVYRYQDAKISSLAAKLALEKVTDNQSKDGYQFQFSRENINASSTYCTGFIADAYREATPSRVEIPMYRSDLYLLNKSDLLFRLGVKDEKVFHPTDIEVDPHFALVAEGRSYADLAGAHRKYSILSSLVRKMYLGKYQTRYSSLNLAKTYYLKMKAYFEKPNFGPSANDIPVAALESVIEIISQEKLLDSELTDKIKEMPSRDSYSIKEYQKILNNIKL
jgi:hypothetical protein